MERGMPPNEVANEKELDSEHSQRVKLALRKTVWSSLKPVSIVLALLYATFTVSHIFLLPLDIKGIMASLAGGSAVIFFCIAISILRITYFERLAYPIAFSILILASLNSATHLFLSGDIAQSTNLILVIFGAGFFILSTPWFLATILITLISWFAASYSLTNQDLFIHFAFALFSSTIVSVVFHFIHVRDLIDNHGLRLVSETQRRELAHLATHDFLTGLANRRKFLEHLELALANSKRTGFKVGVLYCDLNDFKIMNDTFGHEFGDEVLELVSKGLTTVIRQTDMAARFGGDEFAVVLTNIKDPLGMNAVIAKIEKEFLHSKDVKGHQTLIRLSIGQAISPDDCEDIDELLHLADQRMYQHKQQMKQKKTETL
jgi:diguanylate cyclase (GGDEF)-like protein